MSELADAFLRESTPGIVEKVTRTEAVGWVKTPGGATPTVNMYVGPRLHASIAAIHPRRDMDDGAGFRFHFDPPLARDVAPSDVRFDVEGVRALPLMLPPELGNSGLRDKAPHDRLRVPLYASPFFERLMEERQYSEAQKAMVRSFRARGVLKIRLERPDFDVLAAEIMADAAGLYQGAPRYMDGWQASDAIRRLATDAQVGRTLALLYGREAIPMQTLNFPVGTQQSTHTDTVHFNSQPGHFMSGVWVAFEPITDKNGPLHYYPGSHRLPIIDYDDLGVVVDPRYWSEQYEYHQDVLRALIDELKLEREVLHADKGEAIIWAANLMHGGEPIADPRSSRHSQVTHFYYEGISYYTPSLSNAHMGQFHRPDRRDIRTGKPIPHHFEHIRLPFAPTGA